MQKEWILAIKKLVSTRLKVRCVCFLILFGVLCFAIRLGHGNSGGEVLPEDSTLYKEAISIATEWKDAVLDRDIEVLVSLALPEAQKSVRADLKNKESQLYQLFYDEGSINKRESRSVYEILRVAKDLRIVLVAHSGLEKLGNGVTAYYYDEQTLKLTFPLNYEKVQTLLDERQIWVMFFFKAKERWYTSYEF